METKIELFADGEENKDADCIFDVDYEDLAKEGRKLKNYNEGVFEWTHFRVEKIPPAYTLKLLESVINDISFKYGDKKFKFSFAISKDKTYSAIIQGKTSPAKQEDESPIIIKAHVEIY